MESKTATPERKALTREAVEAKIAEMFEKIVEVVKEYEPKTGYFTLSLVEGSIHGFNDFWGEHEEGEEIPDKADFNKIDFWRGDEVE